MIARTTPTGLAEGLPTLQVHSDDSIPLAKSVASPSMDAVADRDSPRGCLRPEL